MAFAGEVFPEWYWGPIFFYVVFGLPLAAAALARRLRGAAVGAPAVVAAARGAVGRACSPPARWRSSAAAPLIEHVRFEREAKAAAQSSTSRPTRPRTSPPASTRSASSPTTSSAGRCSSAATTSGRAASRPPSSSGDPPSSRCRTGAARCTASRGRARASSRVRAARCARRAGGRSTSGPRRRRSRGDEAFALLDGTLVRLQHDRLPDGDVLAYFDALRPSRPRSRLQAGLRHGRVRRTHPHRVVQRARRPTPSADPCCTAATARAGLRLTATRCGVSRAESSASSRRDGRMDFDLSPTMS